MISLFRRRYLISLTYLLVVTAGIVAWLNVPMEMAPEITLPSVTVNYNWGSASPEVMEQEVTRKVEQAAYRLRDVQKVTSITNEGRASITIEFSKNAPVDFRIIELQEHLHALRETLPPSLQPHRITRRVPQELSEAQNFIRYSISGPYSTGELLDIAQRQIRNQIMGIRGIADVDISGAYDPALTIRFDADLVERYNINTNQIMADIRDKLSWRSAGFTESADGRYSMMVPPEGSSTEELHQLRVQISGASRQLRLSDIATVEVEDYPAKSINRINGSSALNLSFVKEGGADALGLAQTIHDRMNEIEQSLPTGILLRMELDITENLREQLDELQFQAVISFLSVFIVLLLFIRTMRAPLIILGSIVFSVMLSVFILYLMGYTINILTLAGLTVSLGMIIDNAVVVFEQINPGLPGSRESRLKHIQNKIKYAIVPVLGSTLTTVGIFIPLFFALESLRMFLTPLAIALTSTLVVSVFISLSWIPYALIWLTPQSKSKTTKKGVSLSVKIQRFFNRLLLRFFIFRNKIRWFVYPALILLIGIPLFAIETPEYEEEEKPWHYTVSNYYFEHRETIDPYIGGISKRFFEEARFRPSWGGRGFSETVNVSVRPPLGSPIDEIDKIIRNFEALGENYKESLLFYETTVSEYQGGNVRFHINPDYLFDPMPYRLYAEAAYLAARTGNVRISVSGLGDSFSTGFGGSSSTFNVRLRGYSYDDLYYTARDLERRLSTNRRVEEIDVNSTGWVSEAYYRYRLGFDDEKILAKGFNRRQLLNAIRMEMNPENTYGMVEFAGQNMYLLGLTKGKDSYQESFMNRMRTYNDINYSLAEFASIEKERTIGQIRRENQSYIRSISFNFLGPHRLGRSYLDGVLETLPLPIGTTIDEQNWFFSFGREEDRKNLLLILSLALLSVWMIVSALLEKWRDPLIIILAVPLSLIGIMIGTLYQDITFDQGAIAGTLLAVGVVVNNAILLLYERERVHKLGVNGLRSWLHVYKTKVRPVMITTLTTIAGLIPLAVMGTNDFWTDMSTVVIWGLSFSTIGVILLAGIWEGKKLDD